MGKTIEKIREDVCSLSDEDRSRLTEELVIAQELNREIAAIEAALESAASSGGAYEFYKLCDQADRQIAQFGTNAAKAVNRLKR